MKRGLLSIWLLPALAGASLPFSFAPYYFWPIAFPSLWLIFRTFAYGNVKQALLQGWSFGLGYFGVGVSWVYISIHEHGNAPIPLAIGLTVVFVAAIALFPAVHFSLAAKLSRSVHCTTNLVIFIAMWVLFEWVRSWLFTGFPWLYLGNAFIDTPLAGWAPITGVYGVSLLVLGSAGATYLAWHYRRVKILLATAASLMTIWISGQILTQIHWTTPSPQAFKVSMVQANTPQEEKWLPTNRRRITKDYLDMTNSLWDSDLIIWPETALPYFKHQAAVYLEKLDKKALETHTTLAMGILSAEFNKRGEATIYNSFTIVGQGEGLYHKQKLVPFGEYVPLESELRGLIQFFNLPMSDMAKGSKQQTSLKFGNSRLMPLICYEVVYPDFVAGYAQTAEVLVTVSNDSWFGGSIGPHQHLQIAQMRALETQKYMLRSTNNGISAIIDSSGRVTAQAPQFEKTVLTGKAYLEHGETPFVITGSTPVIVLLFILIIGAYWQARRRHPAKTGSHEQLSAG